MSAETFAEAYQAAIYKAGGLAFVLSENPTGVVLFEGRRFAIITAHNPKSERLSSEENQKRNEQLEQDLKNLGLEHTFSTGESPDGTWIEKGFAVFDVELEKALELGRKYGQHAILWGEGEKVYLAWCETGKHEGFSIAAQQEKDAHAVLLVGGTGLADGQISAIELKGENLHVSFTNWQERIFHLEFSGVALVYSYSTNQELEGGQIHTQSQWLDDARRKLLSDGEAPELIQALRCYCFWGLGGSPALIVVAKSMSETEVAA